MKRFFLLLLFSLTFSFADAQTYAYSFQGTVDASKEVSLSEKIAQFPAVTGVKLKLKTEQSSGEVIISVDPMENRGEMDHPFSPKFVKDLFIELGLEPGTFRKLQ